MSNKLYVGNLSFKLDNDGLANAFSEFGEVISAKIITDRETGRSRGFGFVEMSSADAAASCVENLDGKDVDGRPLKVSIAQGKPRRRTQQRFSRANRET